MRPRFAFLLMACVVLVAACGDGEPSAALPEPVAATTTSRAAPTAEGDTAPEATSSTAVVGSTTSRTSTTTTAPLVPLEQLQLTLEEVARGFSAPVFATSPPDDPRLFVVDQPGVIWVIDGGDPQVFLDIRDAVVYGGERGLLGLAFDPGFGESGRFFVNYTGSSNATRISEFTASGSTADRESERIMLRIDQPASNHNGGMIAFGPDGNLWVGMGDGGASDDRYGNGQNGQTLLGSMLRIDPRTDPYAIPADNPGNGDPELAPEVWAIGLRNPWRFSFDGTDLWIGDVGQNDREEINVIDSESGAGANFGWPRFEASACYLSAPCDDSDLVAPVLEYRHSEGCSVTGGYVYRGDAIPELDGHYFFGDYCSGWIRALAPSGEVIEWFPGGAVSGLSSFGLDASQELYVVSLNGVIYRMARGG